MNTSQMAQSFLVIAIVFLSAKVNAATSLPPASENVKQLQVPQIFELKEVLRQTPEKFYGIDFYEADKRLALISETKKYLNYRKHPMSADGLNYLLDCSHKLGNAFCDLEMARLVKKDRASFKTTVKPVKKQIAKWFEQLDIEKLEKLSHLEITTYLKSLSNSEKIDKLVSELKSRPACSSAALLTGVAAKLEEYFPEEKYLTDAKALYARAVGCGTDPASLRAAFRLSLLEIWTGDCELAEPLLSSVASGLGDYQSRAKYWRHYCASKLANKTSVTILDSELKNESPINFQNILIHGDEVAPQVSKSSLDPLKIMTRSVIQPEAYKYVQIIEALISLHEDIRAAEFMEFSLSKIISSEPEFKLYMAVLMQKSQNTISEFHILSQLFVESPRMLQEETLKMYFPLSFYEPAKLKAEGLDPLILLSIMRQESAFNPRARSRVGARGLMQVMPPTARFIASTSSRNLFDPATNMKVGVKLFLNQLQRFDGDAELALAAYNAGRLKVEAWKKRYPSEDKMLFLELIPYRETREYVTMILRNYYWYQRLYRRDVKTDYKMPSLIERIIEASRKPLQTQTPPKMPPKMPLEAQVAK
jgi:soluble lytic murein transglycosylase